jgi:hypothetical protein
VVHRTSIFVLISLHHAGSSLIIMELINDIRRRNGGDYEVLRRAQEDPEIARTFAALRANLAQALES